ncbi:MAG: flagellar motor switch protein FliG [Clostridiaceae bacterium]|nr:flagellar motor switch protein FliG [Clostridiaceae bacterium]
MTDETEKSYKEKAAILLISLGKEHSAKVLQQLNDEEIEQLTLEIANVRRIDNQTQMDVIREFQEAYVAQNYILEGGIDYAREMLDQAIGKQKALELITKLTASLQVRPFDFARRLDAAQMLNMIQNEQPQTIALVLSFMEPKQSGAVLSGLPQNIQGDVLSRIARMGKTSPEHIKEVERILEKKLVSLGVSDYTKIGGIQTSVDILNAVDRSTEKHILESLNEHSKDLVDEIKSRMFLFEDIVKLNRVSIQRVLRDVQQEDLVMSLKNAKENVSRFIFENLSSRMQDTIREEMSLTGPVRIKDIEDAQQRIVTIVRNLEDAGEVYISRGSEEMLVG